MYCIGRGLQWLPPSPPLTVLPMVLLPWGDKRPGSMRCLLHSHAPLSQCHHHRVRKGATLMLCMSQTQAELRRYGCAYWTAVVMPGVATRRYWRTLYAWRGCRAPQWWVQEVNACGVRRWALNPIRWLVNLAHGIASLLKQHSSRIVCTDHTQMIEDNYILHWQT